jgi:hypothetical protein
VWFNNAPGKKNPGAAMADNEARGDQFPALEWKTLASDSLALHFEPRKIFEIFGEFRLPERCSTRLTSEPCRQFLENSLSQENLIFES